MGTLQGQKCLLLFLPYMTCWETAAIQLITAHNHMSIWYLRYTFLFLHDNSGLHSFECLKTVWCSGLQHCRVSQVVTVFQMKLLHPYSWQEAADSSGTLVSIHKTTWSHNSGYNPKFCNCFSNKHFIQWGIFTLANTSHQMQKYTVHL
jgi:hypothetical protein